MCINPLQGVGGGHTATNGGTELFCALENEVLIWKFSPTPQEMHPSTSVGPLGWKLVVLTAVSLLTKTEILGF